MLKEISQVLLNYKLMPDESTSLTMHKRSRNDITLRQSHTLMGKSPIIRQKWLEWKIGFQCEGMQIEKIPSISRKLKRGECLQQDILTTKSICDFASHFRRQASNCGWLILSFTDLHSRDNAMSFPLSRKFSKYFRIETLHPTYLHDDTLIAASSSTSQYVLEQYFSSRFPRSSRWKNKIVGNHDEG